MAKKGEIINMEVITTEHGLLYKDGKEIPLPEADVLAQTHGFMFAERLVDHLEKGLPFPPDEGGEITADHSFEEILKELRDLKTQKDDLNKAIKEVNPQIEYLQAIAIAKLQGEGAEKVTTSFGSASISIKDYASIKDFGAFIHYIDTHKAYELIQKRANDAPLRLLWDDEESGGVPGVESFTKTTLNFRKK